MAERAEGELDLYVGRLLEQLQARGLVEIEPGRIRLTAKGAQIARFPSGVHGGRSWRRAVQAGLQRLAKAAGVGPPAGGWAAPAGLAPPLGGSWRASRARRLSRRRPPQVGGGQSTT